MFEPDGPMWVKMVDPEANNVREEDETEEPMSEPPNPEGSENVTANEIVVSHPRRRNHRINEIKKSSSPPMTPSKASTETSSCLVERRL